MHVIEGLTKYLHSGVLVHNLLVLIFLVVRHIPIQRFKGTSNRPRARRIYSMYSYFGSTSGSCGTDSTAHWV